VCMYVCVYVCVCVVMSKVFVWVVCDDGRRLLGNRLIGILRK
jgi:hypothetical protein